MQQGNHVDLGTGSVGKLLFRLALPAITAQIVNVMYNMVSRMYIGHIPGIGPAALTGLGVTMPVIMVVAAFAALVSMGGAPRASIMLGRKEKEKAEEILGNSAAMLVLLSIILTAVLLLFGRPILELFGASPNTIGYAMEYMTIYSIGTIFVQLSLGLNAFIALQGYAKMSMLTVMIGAVANIMLDPLFIFTFKLGVAGAASGTIISQAISAIWVVKFLTSERSYLRLRRRYFNVKPAVVLPCLALGVSPFIMQFTESAIAVSFNTSLLRHGGDLAVGAMTILSSVMQFSLLPLMGLTQGAQPIVSYNFGAQNLHRVKEAFRLLLVASMVYSTALWAVSIFAPRLLIAIFTSDAELTAFSIRAMRVYMGGSLFIGAQIACQQTFIALGNAKVSAFLATLRKVILLIPLIFILPQFMGDKVFAVLLAEPIADILAVCVTVTMFFASFRKLLQANGNQAEGQIV